MCISDYTYHVIQQFSHFMSVFACQAERELQPWIAKDDDQGQKMWRINQRIIKLIVELMRNHERPESLMILASASDLLLRATDGMLVDGEACTLPQLEVTPRKAFTFVIEWYVEIPMMERNIFMRCLHF